MKKVLCSTILCFCFGFLFGQTIEENKIDEFTKSSIKRTSWEVLHRGNMNYNYVRISKINDSYFLDWKIISGIKAIKDGGNFMVRLSNDSVVTLNNDKYIVSCLGCGATGLVGSSAYGINVTISLNAGNIEMLKKFSIRKVRIYYTDGYDEFDIKEKFSDIITKELKLITSNEK